MFFYVDNDPDFFFFFWFKLILFLKFYHVLTTAYVFASDCHVSVKNHPSENMNSWQTVVPLALRTLPSPASPSTSQVHPRLLQDLQAFSPFPPVGPTHRLPPLWTVPPIHLALTHSCPVLLCLLHKPLRNLVDLLLWPTIGSPHLT